MHFITPSQCRAARGMLDWSQPELAEKCGMHIQTISAFENETGTPTKTTLEKITRVFAINEIEFSEKDGVRRNDNPILQYEGSDCYIDFLSDAIDILKVTKGEYLLSSSDDRRSPPKVIDLFREMRINKIPFRQLIENKNTFVMGKLNEYRWMPEGLFINTDCKIIYEDRVGYSLSWFNIPKVIVIKDKAIAEEARRQFNFVWDLSKEPTETTADIRF